MPQNASPCSQQLSAGRVAQSASPWRRWDDTAALQECCFYQPTSPARSHRWPWWRGARAVKDGCSQWFPGLASELWGDDDRHSLLLVIVARSKRKSNAATRRGPAHAPERAGARNEAWRSCSPLRTNSFPKVSLVPHLLVWCVLAAAVRHAVFSQLSEGFVLYVIGIRCSARCWRRRRAQRVGVVHMRVGICPVFARLRAIRGAAPRFSALFRVVWLSFARAGGRTPAAPPPRCCAVAIRKPLVDAPVWWGWHPPSRPLTPCCVCRSGT